MGYRSDIDGLRGLAVLSVLAFHAGGLLSGGFVGVDVFFVISGFLITRLILAEQDAGSFSLTSFYRRRIRRLMPALAAMLAASFVAATALMMPRDFADFSKSVVAVAGSVSNMLFWWQTGYFDGAADAKPLLHTWSLAVEEQFYFTYPLLLMVLARRSARTAAIAIGGLAIASFGLCLWLTGSSPTSAFYLAPARAWELLAGALLAIGAVPSLRDARMRDAVSVAGLSAICAAAALFADRTQFPGIAALLPVAGAAAIIHAGPEAVANRALSWRPLVLVGLASYSLYLWHWPIFVFAEYYAIDPLTGAQTAAAIAVSFAAAWVSYRYVEQPFRRTRGAPVRWIAGTVLAGSGFAAAGLAVVAFAGLPERFSPAVRAVLATAPTPYAMNQCGGPCARGADGSVLVWGDSHADALVSGWKAPLYLAAHASCPPLRLLATGDACRQANDEALAFAMRSPEIRTVVLAARWTAYTDGRAVKIGPAESNRQMPELVTATGRHLARFSPATRAEFAAALRDTVTRLTSAGKRVVIVYPIPEVGYDVPSTIARLMLKGADGNGFTRPASLFAARNSETIGMLDSLPYGAKLKALRPSEQLCNAQECWTSIGGHPLYWDDDHLSLAGSAIVSQALARVIRL